MIAAVAAGEVTVEEAIEAGPNRGISAGRAGGMTHGAVVLGVVGAGVGEVGVGEHAQAPPKAVKAACQMNRAMIVADLGVAVMMVR